MRFTFKEIGSCAKTAKKEGYGKDRENRYMKGQEGEFVRWRKKEYKQECCNKRKDCKE